jgi:hypothetical protein
MSSDDASFFFWLDIRGHPSGIWHEDPTSFSRFSFIFPSPKIQRERRRYTHVCAVSREWNSMLTSLVTAVFFCFFFFILASSYFLGIPARRHREMKWKINKNHKKKEQKKKSHWRLSVCLFLFFSSFLNPENIIQVNVILKLLRLDLNNLLPLMERCTIGSKEKGVGAIFVIFFKNRFTGPRRLFSLNSFWLIYISWFCCLPSLHNLRHRKIYESERWKDQNARTNTHGEKWS